MKIAAGAITAKNNEALSIETKDCCICLLVFVLLLLCTGS